ncbi:MAG: phage holin family protein [Microgenomates group bacterium]
MGIIINLLINGLAVYISARVIPGVSIDSFVTAIIVSVVLGVVNTFLKPILFILTLPATILTLGLFTFVINALMVYLVATFVTGFHVNGFWTALIFSLVLSLVSSVLRALTSD